MKEAGGGGGMVKPIMLLIVAVIHRVFIFVCVWRRISYNKPRDSASLSSDFSTKVR